MKKKAKKLGGIILQVDRDVRSVVAKGEGSVNWESVSKWCMHPVRKLPIRWEEISRGSEASGPRGVVEVRCK